MSDSQFLLHIDLISNMRRERMRAGPRSLASSSRSPAGRKRAERNLTLVDKRFNGGPVDQDLDRLDMPRHWRRIALAGHRLVREGHGRASDAEVQGRAIGDLDLGQDTEQISGHLPGHGRAGGQGQVAPGVFLTLKTLDLANRLAKDAQRTVQGA